MHVTCVCVTQLKFFIKLNNSLYTYTQITEIKKKLVLWLLCYLLRKKMWDTKGYNPLRNEKIRKILLRSLDYLLKINSVNHTSRIPNTIIVDLCMKEGEGEILYSAMLQWIGAKYARLRLCVPRWSCQVHNSRNRQVRQSEWEFVAK